jgi:hypothetical protein
VIFENPRDIAEQRSTADSGGDGGLSVVGPSESVPGWIAMDDGEGGVKNTGGCFVTI